MELRPCNGEMPWNRPGGELRPMDPEANLTEQREIAAEMLRIQDHCDDDGRFTEEQARDLERLGLRLAELVEALDGWIKGGGFLPRDWQRDVHTNGLQVAAVTKDAVYVQLTGLLKRPCGGCSCDYCKAHPKEAPTWDMLVVPMQRAAWTWNVHAPDVRQMREGFIRSKYLDPKTEPHKRRLRP